MTERARARRDVRWALALAILLAVPRQAGAQTDRVTLRNGDRFVGEIKELFEAELRFKTGYILSDFQIDWTQVERLESPRMFRITLNDGRRLTGTLARFPDGRFVVTSAGAAATFGWTDIFAFKPVQANFWAQLTGQVNSGFSYTSDGSDTQFSASGSVGYAADRYALNVSGSSNFTGHADSTDEAGTTRNVADVLVEVPLAPQWYAGGLLGLLQSDQQDLTLRTTAGGGIGRWLARTRHSQLSTFGGLVYTHEQYGATADGDGSDPDETGSNVEAIAALTYTFHRFKTVDVQSKFIVYPSLSTPGRLRLSVGPALNLEVAHNLYWNFTLYENYDSHPPVNAGKNDFGVTNAIGWKF